MQQTRRILARLASDLKTDNFKERILLWFANLVPNLYFLKIAKAAALKMAGVNVGFDSLYFRSPICIDSPKSVSIKPGVFINRNVYFEGEGVIVVGENSQIGPNVVITTTAHDIFDRMNTLIGNVEIDSNVWIGAGAIILKGVRLGPNVVVAAGAVVNSSFSNCVIAGVPAKCVKVLQS